MFFEGMCSCGCGLLLFKIGVFYIVIFVGVLIILIVCLMFYNKIDLNCWDNGMVICEELELIDISGYN